MPIPEDASWLPATVDLARQMRNRAYVGGGRAPDFLNENEDDGPTDPSRDEAQEFIADAVSDLESKVGSVPEGAERVAKRVVVLGAALLVEVGSEDFDQERYDRLKAIYDERLTQLLDVAQDVETGGEVGNADDRVTAIASFSSSSSDDVPGSETSWDVIGKNGIWDC